MVTNIEIKNQKYVEREVQWISEVIENACSVRTFEESSIDLLINFGDFPIIMELARHGYFLLFQLKGGMEISVSNCYVKRRNLQLWRIT